MEWNGMELNSIELDEGKDWIRCAVERRGQRCIVTER
jgi:hypothetical protein